MPFHPATVLLGSVTGAQEGAELGESSTSQSLGRMSNPGQRGSQIAIHVVGESLERGYVEDPASFLMIGEILGQQAIEGP